MTLIPITEATHPVEIDLRYATSDNFTGQPVYLHADCYLHPEAEKRLRVAISVPAVP